MGAYGFLGVCGDLWVFMSIYGRHGCLLVFMGVYGCLTESMGAYRFTEFLWVFLGIFRFLSVYGCLWGFMGVMGVYRLWVFMGF